MYQGSPPFWQSMHRVSGRRGGRRQMTQSFPLGVTGPKTQHVYICDRFIFLSRLKLKGGESSE